MRNSHRERRCYGTYKISEAAGGKARRVTISQDIEHEDFGAGQEVEVVEVEENGQTALLLRPKND